MGGIVTDEEQQQAVEQQIQNERLKRIAAADALGAFFNWGFAVARAHPEDIGIQAWQSGATLELRYSEHDAVLVLGVRAADGTKYALHAASADRTSPESFGRPLDSLLRAALEAVPLPQSKPQMLQ
jgi:hypothetical protein